MYQSTASLWALHRYIIIGATGPESNLQATPADTQSTALMELLQSRSFTNQIAKATNVVSTLHLSPAILADPQRLEEALLTELSRQVRPTSGGYNLYAISYANSDPLMAQRVVKATIDTFAAQSQSFSLVEAGRFLDYYKEELAQAQAELRRATAAELAYMAAHPHLNQAGLAADPTYASLQARAQQAQATVGSVQSNIGTVNDEMAAQGSRGMFQVLDPPLPGIAASRTSKYLVGGGIGLGLALLACAAYLMVLVRRDTAVYSARELQQATGYPVLAELPALHLRSPERPLLIDRSVELHSG
jgi:hypothetical protein